MNGEAAPDGPEGIQFSDDVRDAYCAIGVLVFQALASLLSMFAAPQAHFPQKVLYCVKALRGSFTGSIPADVIILKK